MAYFVPAASAVDFAPIRRPSRLHALPGLSGTMLMDGPLVPPEVPRLRRRALVAWVPADEWAAIGRAGMTGMDERDARCSDRMRLAAPLVSIGASRWCSATPADLRHCEHQQLAACILRSPAISGWEASLARDSRLYVQWTVAVSVPTVIGTHQLQILSARDRRGIDTNWSVNLRDRPFDPRYDLTPPLHMLPIIGQSLPFADGYVVPAAISVDFSFNRDVTPRSIYPRNSVPHTALLGQLAERDRVAHGRWGAGAWYSHGGYPSWGDDSGGQIGQLDPPPAPIEAPYHIMNSIQCFALVGDERIALAPDNIKVTLLIESYTWEMTADLYGRTSVNYLRPDASGLKHIELLMNGHKWLFAIKSYRRSTKLASETYSFTAQSRSMLLDGDQSDKLTVTLPTAMGAWQLVEQVLQPLGFSIERTAVAEWVQTPEWTLAAQSASWVSVTPMAIISSIAKACGAVVMPDMTEDKLIITPRYRVSPSKWATAPASAWSHLIPEAVIPSESSDPQFTTPLDRVLIAGTTHGCITEVVRSGSAGVVSAADVSDVLAQDPAANAERGRNLLAESGQIEIVTLELPLLPPGQSPTLVVPGQLVKVLRGDGSETRGLVLGNSITPNGVSAIWQSVSLEVHHGNS
jgi:hypothetical protein